MKKLAILTTTVLVALISCNKQSSISITKEILNSDPVEFIIEGNPSIRGLDVFDSETVWLSGSKGTYAVSTDKGANWKTGTINNDTLLDFRDIVAFGKESAIAISAGSPAKIYKTTDKGNTWTLTYKNDHPGIFFDSFEFWDERNGIACADPLKGEFFFLVTYNGGNSWKRIHPRHIPLPLEQEGGFAASGTCVAVSDNGIAMFGTGGDEARVIVTHDYGMSWKAITTPIKTSSPTHGIYSIHWIGDRSFAITGGSYLDSDLSDQNFAISHDGGLSWELTPKMPNGYRSCVKSLDENIFVVCGKAGVDISYDKGKSWINKELEGFYTFDISNDNSFAVFAGANGKIGTYKLD